MPLSTEVGPGPGHIVLDGNPAPHGNGTSAPQPPNTVRGLRTHTRSVCNVGVLWPNGSIDQDATWYRGILGSGSPHCVRWGPSTTSPKGHSP